MNAHYAIGDRVVVESLGYGYDSKHVGRHGTVKGRRPSGALLVEVEGPSPEQVIATGVRRELLGSQIKVGDFVAITGTATAVLLGAKGTVTQARNGDYAIRLSERCDVWSEGSTVYARSVEKVSSPSTEAEPEVLIDLKRLQAAHAAHTLLGKDALLEDLIGVSEFILDEHIRTSASVSDGETAAPEVDLTSVLTVTDRDGDEMEVERRVGGGVYITASNDRGSYGPSVIVAGDDLDRVIAYLQAAKAADTSDF